MELKNCRTNCNPDTTLYKEEVNVILTVVEDALRKLQRPMTTGSLLLVGQKDGEDKIENVIMEFDFEGGAVEKRYEEKSSSWVVHRMATTMSAIRAEEKGIIVCYPEDGYGKILCPRLAARWRPCGSHRRKRRPRQSHAAACRR